MLDNTYDGDYRLRHFCELKEKYKLGDYSEDVHAFDYINRMRQDLMVDNKVLDNLILFGDVDIYCLLPWTRNSVFVEKKSRYVFKYPCVEGRDIPDTKHFEISLSDMYNFWIHKMYTLEANILRYRSFRDYGGGVGFCELPFNHASEDDGQLKITVDAILAAGAMTSRKKKKY